MSNNIIFNKKLEEYNKKYRNGRYKLLKYTKKEVEQYDKIANQTLKTKNYLLRGRKWALIGDTYYEIPKAPRALWFRNVNAGVKAATCALVGGAALGGAGYGIYVAVANKSPVVKPFSKEDVELDEETSKVVTVKEAKKDDKGNEIVVLEAKEDDKYVESVEVKIGGDTLTQGEEASGGQCSFDEKTGILTVYEKTAKEKEGKVNVAATVADMSPVESIDIENEEKTHQVEIGKQLHFKATCNPTYPKQKVMWSIQEQEETSNSIDEKTGVFVANEAGTFHVIATAGDGSFTTGTYDIEVIDYPIEKCQLEVKLFDENEGAILGVLKNYKPGSDVCIRAHGIEDAGGKKTQFAGWYTENKVLIQTESEYHFVINSNTTIFAKFIEGDCEETINVSIAYDQTMGQVAGEGPHIKGQKIGLSATPNDGAEFIGWYQIVSGKEKLVSQNTYYQTSLPLNEDTEFRAQFKQKKGDKINIYANCNPTGAGTITGAGEYELNKTVTLKVESNDPESYEFEYWIDKDDPMTQIKTATITFTATTDKAYIANFKDVRPSFTVTPHCDSTKGIVSVNPEGGSVKKGENAIVYCTPNKSHDFIGWYDNSSFEGTALSTDPVYTIENVTGNKDVYAKIEPHTVTSIKISTFHNIDVDTPSTRIACYENDTTTEAWVDWSTNVSEDILKIDEDGYVHVQEPKTTTISCKVKAKLKIAPYCEDEFDIEIATDPSKGYFDITELKKGSIKAGNTQGEEKLVIPSRYWDNELETEDKFVTQTSIAKDAFRYVGPIKTVYIPTSITSIGIYAFYKPAEGTPNLTSVIFEDKEGWSIGGTAITADQLSDPSDAANLILNNLDKQWTKN